MDSKLLFIHLHQGVIYIRLKIKPNSVRIRFLSCQIFIKVANCHGYHLEHLSGLRRSSSERQKVANNNRTPEEDISLILDS
jgi:hypothetical protein